jgi:hypothetical protein
LLNDRNSGQEVFGRMVGTYVKSRIILHIVSLGIIFGMSGCGSPDYETPLPNGYRLVRTNAYTVFIFPPESVKQLKYRGTWAVGPKIVALNANNNIIFGKVDHSPNADPGPTTPGYFILDTTKHEAVLGLNEADWTKKLNEYGISNPKTKKPSRF